jgi:hypothetical protein
MTDVERVFGAENLTYQPSLVEKLNPVSSALTEN